MIPDGGSDIALLVLRVASPALVFLAALSLFSANQRAPPAPSPITTVVVASRVPRRALIISLLVLAALTYLLDGLAFVLYAVFNKTYPHHTGIEINAIVGLVAFVGIAALGSWKDAHGAEVWALRRVKSAIGLSLLLDIAAIILAGSMVPDKDPHHYCDSRYSECIPSALHLVLPLFRVLFLLPLFVCLFTPRVVYSTVSSDEDTIRPPQPTASTFLIPREDGAVTSSAQGEAGKYGTFGNALGVPISNSGATTRSQTPTLTTTTPHAKKTEQAEVTLDPSWREMARRISHLTPFLWPTKHYGLQFLAFLCVLVVILGRFVSPLLPISLGGLVDAFDTGAESPWPYLFAYVVLRFLQSGGGLPALRDALWVPVMQYSDREMSQMSFTHLLNLSHGFHVRRKTGEVLRILDRGAAVNRVFELLMFNIVPAFADIIIAVVVIAFRFDWMLSLVIFAVMFGYVTASVVLTRYRTKLRRQMNDRDVITRGIHTDCLLNYETVKYFSGEEHEISRYRDALSEYQKVEYRVMISLDLLNLVQTLIVTLGLLVGSLIVALRITRGESSTGDFVVWITYFVQLYAPLSNLGSVYRMINQSLVDTERLLQLLSEPSDVLDRPGAPDLIVQDGEVEFQNVSFSYDERQPALHNVSFKVPKGSSIALVGESGAGKSTILRLLYRFYDLKEGQGRILIDGQDIKDITQASLRRSIGVVPQDPVLFNTSIGYNIGYGRFGASQEEIENAAQAAHMHERISTFPDGYETKVGERGVRLSGGEKQRVAIARTLLKDPPILLLDEATSALDTATEKDIQKALVNLQKGRSSISIAHRLSTIASADIILVLKDGQIIEQGSHRELLKANGVFASMWAEQISASEDPAFASSSKAPSIEPVTGYDAAPSMSERASEQAPTVKSSSHRVGPSEHSADRSQVTGVGTGSVMGTGSVIGTGSVMAAGTQPTDTPRTRVTMVEPDNISHVTTEPPQVPSKDDIVMAPAEAAVPISFPTTDEPEPIPASIAFPSGDEPAPDPVSESPAPAAAPIAFPGSDSTPNIEAQVAPGPSTPGVTFETIDPPEHSGSPDPDAEPKRKRTASQNFQRMARRISISNPVRKGSMLPAALRRDSSQRVFSKDSSKNDAGTAAGPSGEGEIRPSVDSPAASVTGDPAADKKLKKKSKRKTFM